MTGISAIRVTNELFLYHKGPALDHGPLPSLFYLSLSGPDSLGKDPFNQPVQFLHGKMIRIFSLTLPAHENDLPPTEAIQTWAEDYLAGRDPLEKFLQDLKTALDFGIENQFIAPKKIAIAGLSRGALLAFHGAARDPRFRAVLGFAPVTRLSTLKEFSTRNLDPGFDAFSLGEALADRHIRLYIGNHDTRVHTRSCFEFAMELVKEADKKKIRSPQIECLITPSIGQHGHGTSPEIFQQGAHWIGSILESHTE